MTLNDIKALVAGIDQAARHYFSEAQGDAYTYWEETQRLPLTADDAHAEGWRFYIHRYTKDESDQTALDIFSTLDADPRVTVIHTVDYETDSGYLHHIFQCEGY